MSFYEPQAWQAPIPRQVPWDQPIPPSRSGTVSAWFTAPSAVAVGVHDTHICFFFTFQGRAPFLNERRLRLSRLSSMVWTHVDYLRGRRSSFACYEVVVGYRLAAG